MFKKAHVLQKELFSFFVHPIATGHHWEVVNRTVARTVIYATGLLRRECAPYVCSLAIEVSLWCVFWVRAITASPCPAAPAVPAGCPQEAPGRAGLPEGSPEWASPAEGAGGWECPWPCAPQLSVEAPIAPTAPRSQHQRRVPSSAARSPPAAARSPVSAARFQIPVGPPGCVGRRWWSAAPLDEFCRLSGLYCQCRALGQCLCSSGGTARCRTRVRRVERRLYRLWPAVGGGVASGLRRERAGAFWACPLALLASIAPRSASAAWRDCPSEAPETSEPT